MTLRVPMVSLERARELGEAMGMPARRTRARRSAWWPTIPVWHGWHSAN